jgi:hypothetical protein
MRNVTLKTDCLELKLWAANDVNRAYKMPLNVLVADYITSDVKDNGDFYLSMIYFLSSYGSFGIITNDQWRTIDRIYKELQPVYAKFCQNYTDTFKESIYYVIKSYSVLEIQAVIESVSKPITNDNVFSFVAALRALQNTFSTKCITITGKIA